MTSEHHRMMSRSHFSCFFEHKQKHSQKRHKAEYNGYSAECICNEYAYNSAENKKKIYAVIFKPFIKLFSVLCFLILHKTIRTAPEISRTHCCSAYYAAYPAKALHLQGTYERYYNIGRHVVCIHIFFGDRKESDNDNG